MHADTISIGALGVANHPLARADSGHPLLGIADFVGTEQFGEQYRVRSSSKLAMPPEVAVFQVAVEQEVEESTAEARLLRMLESKTIQLVTTRTNVGPGSHRTMCLGGYTQRGVGITMKSWEFQ
eukprot:2069140-Amphidinium_carterae.1